MALYPDGTVGIIRIFRSGVREQKYEPLPGFTTVVAADFINGRLSIAYLSLYGGKLRIDTHVVQ